MTVFIQRDYNAECPSQLKDAVNLNPAITPECIQVVVDQSGSPFITYFEFDTAPSAGEEAELDSMIYGSPEFSCFVEEDNTVDTQEFDDMGEPDENVIWSSERISALYDMENLGAGNGVFAQKVGDGTGSPDAIVFELKSLVAGNNVTITPSGSTLTIASTGGVTDVDEDHIIYVGKHGNDGNDGRTIDKAVLTFGQALTLCNAESPSVSNQWGVVCLDNGIYTENIALTTTYTRVFAANAILEGKVTLTHHTSFEFEAVYFTGPGNAVEMVSGTGTAYGEIKHLKTTNANGVVNNTSGILNVEIEYYEQSGGIGFVNDSISHADIQDWDVYGDSPTLVKTTGGMTNVRSANHSDRGGTGTSLGYDCDGGITNVFVIRACPDKLYDVESGATLNLMVIDTCGVTRENDGTVNELETSHASDTSNPHSVTSSQVGLGNVDNTSDLNKPISTATQTALDGKGDVSSSAGITDNRIVRGDGGTKGIQESGWTIDDSNRLTVSSSVIGTGSPRYSSDDHFIMHVHNTATAGGGGLFIQAGESEDDIAFRIMDENRSFHIVDVHADNGNWVFGAGFTDTKIANGVVYGFDNQYGAGTDADFNTQNGTFRIGGVDVIVPTGGTVGQVLEKIDGTSYNMQWATPSGGGASTLNDLTDATITSPTSGEHLVYNGSMWVNTAVGQGSDSKRMNSWTLLSGSLYYNDFVHNLSTTEVAYHLRDYTTDIEVRPEYSEVIDANTFRIVVEGNTCDIVCNVTTGKGAVGPAGPAGGGMANVVEDLTPQLGGNLDVNGFNVGGVTPTELSYVDATSSIQTQLNSKIGNVVEDTSPQLGGDLDMNLKNIQYSVPTGDLTTSGIIVSATVDSNAIGVGSALYMAVDGNFDQTDADSTATMPCRALAAESGTGTKKVLLQGFLRKNAWNWTVGADLYISNTSGTLTHTPPSGTGDQVQKVGFAWTADIIYFNPGDYTIVEVA